MTRTSDLKTTTIQMSLDTKEKVDLLRELGFGPLRNIVEISISQFYDREMEIRRLSNQLAHRGR